LTPAISLSRTVRPPAGFTFPALATATTPGIATNDLNRLQGMVNDLLGIPATLSHNFLGDLKSDTFAPFLTGPQSVSLWAQGQRTKQYNFFFQDEWKLKRNLTMSIGARWELNPPPTEAGGRVYVPDKEIVGGQGLVSFVKADRWFRNNNAGAVAPRLSFAWSPGDVGGVGGSGAGVPVHGDGGRRDDGGLRERAECAPERIPDGTGAADGQAVEPIDASGFVAEQRGDRTRV
jgi:hypothetical protein